MLVVLISKSTILKYYMISYHVYVQQHTHYTQLHISCKCKELLEAILKVNSILSDNKGWMITNKLKINDWKT